MMVEEVSEVPHKAMRITSEVVEVGCGTIMAVDQATSRVHGASSEASDDYVAMWRRSLCCSLGRIRLRGDTTRK